MPYFGKKPIKYKDMLCSDLIKLAPENKRAASILCCRARKWTTCAVGEAAYKLKMSPYNLMDLDRTNRIEELGLEFVTQCARSNWADAKKTITAIAKRVKQVVKKIKK